MLVGAAAAVLVEVAAAEAPVPEEAAPVLLLASVVADEGPAEVVVGVAV